MRCFPRQQSRQLHDDCLHDAVGPATDFWLAGLKGERLLYIPCTFPLLLSLLFLSLLLCLSVSLRFSPPPLSLNLSFSLASSILPVSILPSPSFPSLYVSHQSHSLRGKQQTYIERSNVKFCFFNSKILLLHVAAGFAHLELYSIHIMEAWKLIENTARYMTPHRDRMKVFNVV